MKKQIEKWLFGNRDYQQGVALYDKYGRSFTLKKKFRRKENDMFREKLAYELAQLAGYDNVPNKKKPQASGDQPESTQQEVSKTTTRHLTAWKDLPLEVKELILSRDKLMEKRKKIHAGYHDIPPTNHKPNKEKRVELRQQLIDLSKDIRAIVVAIRHYDEHQKLPEGFVKKGSKKDLQKRFNNLKSQKSKYKAQVSGNKTKKPLPDGPKKEEARQKLEEIESEMANIRKLLDE